MMAGSAAHLRHTAPPRGLGGALSSGSSVIFSFIITFFSIQLKKRSTAPGFHVRTLENARIRFNAAKVIRIKVIQEPRLPTNYPWLAVETFSARLLVFPRPTLAPRQSGKKHTHSLSLSFCRTITVCSVGGVCEGGGIRQLTARCSARFCFF